jgi:hypothetical protein
MATMYAASQLKVAFDDKSEQVYDLGYQPFFVTGDMVSDGKGGQVLAGGYYDIYNNKIIDKTVSGKERHFFSDSPDGTSLLTVPDAKVDGVKGKPVFAVVQFEYTTWAQDGTTDMYGKLPSPIAVLTLDQDQTTGKLSLVKYHNVDTSKVHGLWITCGASLSPWGTHLSSEEYEPDAFSIASNTMFQAFSQNLYGDANKANPYHYGHMPEVIVNVDGTATIKKHFCMGRISHELVQVMPDQRTALMGDDATNSGYFVFVADKEKDLSSGTLYAAKVGAGFSIDPPPRAPPLTWIKLGSATSAEIENLANTLKPTDIMTVSRPTPATPATPRSWPTARPSGSRSTPAWTRPPPSSKPIAMPPSRAPAWASPRWKARPSTPRTRSPTPPCRTCSPPWWPAMPPTWPATASRCPSSWWPAW